MRIFLFFLFFLSCKTTTPIENKDSVILTNESLLIDYRTQMRTFVIEISSYAKKKKNDFIIIPQNGMELVTDNGEHSGSPEIEYLKAIDGHGQEDFLFGYNNDDKKSPSNSTNYVKEFLNISKNYGNKILIIDYCSSPDKINESYTKNNNQDYISFAADQRNLNTIPEYPEEIYGKNNLDIKGLSDAKNFLYILNYDDYFSKKKLIESIEKTNYDAVVIDCFFSDGSQFTLEEVNRLKRKKNGGSRKVISYMSIGEAEDYRFYWNDDWLFEKPNWLDKENENWEGNYKVKYWDKDWKQIIYGQHDSYLDKIIESGYDGVYLDIIDAFEYFENL